MKGFNSLCGTSNSPGETYIYLIKKENKWLINQFRSFSSSAPAALYKGKPPISKYFNDPKYKSLSRGRVTLPARGRETHRLLNRRDFQQRFSFLYVQSPYWRIGTIHPWSGRVYTHYHADNLTFATRRDAYRPASRQRMSVSTVYGR